MINLQNIKFSYDNDDFNLCIDHFNLKAGECLALTGVSGSGKSTLMKIISGEIPASGEISVLQKDLQKLTSKEKRALRLKSIGMILQDSALLEYLSVKDNILMPFLRRTKIDPDYFKSLYTTCGLTDLLHRKPDQLSEGEKQRAAICRALITQPQLILADEPTSSLDPKNANGITDLLLELCQKNKCSLLMITHSESQLDKFDRVVDITEISGVRNA